MKTRIRCISCGSMADWVQGNRFSCRNCGSFFSSKTSFGRCPICSDEVRRQDVIGDYYPYGLSIGKPVQRYFHSSCLESYNQELVEQELQFHKEIEKAEAIATLACPHCGETGWIGTYPAGYDDVEYICDSCDEEVSENWVTERLRELGFEEIAE